MPSPKNNKADVLIDVKEVKKSFQDKTILDGVSLDVHEHEVVAVIGTSGCGKSTLLRLISGLDEPDEGEIILSDPNYSMVFQYSALFDSLTVFENVAFSLIELKDYDIQTSKHFREKAISRKRSHYPDADVKKIVMEKLRLVGLENVADKYPNQLSGGMQKRVSFARAIANNPRIILYDEPTSGLDPIASTVIEDYIIKLRNELQAAGIVVTHQFSTIQRTADRVCLLHQGKIKWRGTPHELMTSTDPYAYQFAHASLEGPITQETAT